ncbi:unnamed protein product [Adineta steineri]|nr:unnamed protein product [Adineta steineri]
MDDISTVRNIDELATLKYFSFKYDYLINSYDTNILPLFRRMKYLEKLTLYLRVQNRSTFLDKTHLENEILSYIPTLQLFTFYISTYNETIDLFHNMVAQQSMIYIKNQHVNSIINYISDCIAVCSIFSIPFAFHRLEDIGNLFPDIIFNHVTYLLVQDINPFNHEFFIRLARAFPLLKTLRVFNCESQSSNTTDVCLDESTSNVIAEYPHLTVLDVTGGEIDYTEQFLNETKTYVPCLIQLIVIYNDLRLVTNNFTRQETRRNCANVQRLEMIRPLAHTHDFYVYFPLL